MERASPPPPTPYEDSVSPIVAPFTFPDSVDPLRFSPESPQPEQLAGYAAAVTTPHETSPRVDSALKIVTIICLCTHTSQGMPTGIRR